MSLFLLIIQGVSGSMSTFLSLLLRLESNLLAKRGNFGMSVNTAVLVCLLVENELITEEIPGNLLVGAGSSGLKFPVESISLGKVPVSQFFACLS